jgi:predicted component of type VI protein secretion system
MQKSLNQLYKESGTTLTYKEWRKREDDKMASFGGIVSPNLKDRLPFQQAQNEINKIGGFKNEISGNTILGINKYVVIFGALIVTASLGYVIYKKIKK